MKNKMTKKEFQSLLNKVQEIQCKDFGAHDMSVIFYHGRNRNETWFNCAFYIRKKIHVIGCYRWRSYDDNIQEINKELELINYKIEK